MEHSCVNDYFHDMPMKQCFACWAPTYRKLMIANKVLSYNTHKPVSNINWTMPNYDYRYKIHETTIVHFCPSKYAHSRKYGFIIQKHFYKIICSTTNYSYIQRSICRRSNISTSWWRHQMDTFYALLAFCEGNSPVTGELFVQRPVMRSFDVLFDLFLNKRLSKQSLRRRFETQSRSLWRHCIDGRELFNCITISWIVVHEKITCTQNDTTNNLTVYASPVSPEIKNVNNYASFLKSHETHINIYYINLLNSKCHRNIYCWGIQHQWLLFNNITRPFYFFTP